MKTICTECKSRVMTNYVEGTIDKNKAYKAACKCSEVLGRSEKRVMNSFKHFYDTVEVER
jgi:hypothetical protein